MKNGTNKIAVIFEVTPTAEGKARYFELGAMLKDYLQKMPGFISVERFESVSTPGKFLSLSFWESEEAASGWRNQMNHRASQKEGHDKLFKNYRISVGHIVREYTDSQRAEAPADSNAAIIND
ncbi:MAG: antibiotic biosynthesis monooxygenase [Bacteroidales bacterium]|nr:antibiotic biosynthesis monooxygenase [Bacteroidales bacterium]